MTISEAAARTSLVAASSELEPVFATGDGGRRGILTSVNRQVVVVDYGAGNLRSVARAIAHVGASPVVSADPDDIAAASALVLPGVGAAADTMANLRSRGLVEPILRYIGDGRPFLGVCMGLQALFDWSEEGGGQECLGVLPGRIRHFPAGELKVPHMGWNSVDWLRDHPLTSGIPSGSLFYFVHGFYPSPDDPAIALGETEYGVRFPSVVARDNVVATQFHPEKSGANGLRLYANFLAWARAGRSGDASRESAVA
ncbi:MAG: imidazole glycerol phosphate synthase subunit HisH [Dehalococcoidia bacterium]|nr:imidazole glycerol phosphate synthase subunit HisH [Dehalococcoidia bacterium]